MKQYRTVDVKGVVNTASTHPTSLEWTHQESYSVSSPNSVGTLRGSYGR